MTTGGANGPPPVSVVQSIHRALHFISLNVPPRLTVCFCRRDAERRLHRLFTFSEQPFGIMSKNNKVVCVLKTFEFVSSFVVDFRISLNSGNKYKVFICEIRSSVLLSMCFIPCRPCRFLEAPPGSSRLCRADVGRLFSDFLWFTGNRAWKWDFKENN